jgi:hypothetical protein
MEKPFQNWTRQSSELIGTIFLYLDYTAPVELIRERLNEILKNTNLWDGKVANLQVTDCKMSTIELRALVSARDSGALWNLRCQVREQLIAFLQQQFPNALPRQRTAVELPADTFTEQKPQHAG